MGLRSWSWNRRLDFARSSQVNRARARELIRQAKIKPTTIEHVEKARELYLFANRHYEVGESFHIKATRKESALHPGIIAEHVRNHTNAAIDRHIIEGQHDAMSAHILEKSQNPADIQRAKSLLRKRKRHHARAQIIQSLSNFVLRILGQTP